VLFPGTPKARSSAPLVEGLGSITGVTDEHDLYGLPLEGFISARTELAKALRKDGHRERAGEVSALRKPSVAAWAVNQLVRTRGRDVTALFQAGDALQDAQSRLLAGRGDGHALREAVTSERQAVSRLVEQAGGLLSSDGHELTQTTLDRVSDTLHAAALDGDARALFEDGCLVRELRHVGLGQGDTLSPAASPPPSSPRPASRSSDAARRAETRRTERERAERLKLARKAEADTRRAAQRAARELHTAQARRDKAAESLQGAEDALAEARERADRATLERDRARHELDQL
jgi:hypothetical protein